MNKPSNAVPILTISELTNHVQNESPFRIFVKWSVVKESPICPPRAFPSEKAMSMIQINGITVMATKCNNVMCVEMEWYLLLTETLRIKPYSIAESESFLEVHTVTGTPDSHSRDKPDGISVQQ